MARKSLKKLRRSGAVWEAGMIHATYEQDGATAVGLLVVVERGTGVIRKASAVMAGESPAVLFRDAFVAPQSPAKPERPRHVVFDDPWLRDQVKSVLEEARILSVSTGTAPALDDAIARLLHGAGAPVAPGIDADLPAWRAAIQDLIHVGPWSTLDDRVVFSFSGRGLETRTATITGHRGELLGVVLRNRRTEGPATDGRLGEAVHLMLEGGSGLSAAEVEGCLRVGMQFPPGLYPRVYAVTPEGFGHPTLEQSTCLLTAVRAITELCHRDGALLAAGETATLELDDMAVTGARDSLGPRRGR